MAFRHSGHTFPGNVPLVRPSPRGRLGSLGARLTLTRTQLIALFFLAWGGVFGGIGIFILAAIIKSFRYW